MFRLSMLGKSQDYDVMQLIFCNTAAEAPCIIIRAAHAMSLPQQ